MYRPEYVTTEAIAAAIVVAGMNIVWHELSGGEIRLN